MTASILCKSECILGESPLWIPEKNRLMWVDIERKRIYEYNCENQQICYWQLDKRVSLLVPSIENNTLILGMQGGMAKLCLSDNRLFWLSDIEKELEQNRCNDGACDVKGRLWVGTMSTNFDADAGSLYLLDEHSSITRKLSDVTISNGLVWSLDNKKMYFIDTVKRCVQSFFFDSEKGSIEFEKIVVEIPESLGSPDGMTIDEEGMLWIAHYGGFGVYRWNPNSGILIEKISLPVPNITSCVFGGKNLDILFITTARQELSKEELNQYPESGNVFYFKTRVKGLPANKCHLQGLKNIFSNYVCYPKYLLS